MNIAVYNFLFLSEITRKQQKKKKKKKKEQGNIWEHKCTRSKNAAESSGVLAEVQKKSG